MIERLHFDPEAVFGLIRELGGFYAQARNHGGGLGRQLSKLDLIPAYDQISWFDPENGISVAGESLLAFHAGTIPSRDQPVPILDFDFEGFPAGFSLLEFPDHSTPGSIDRLVQVFGTDIVSEETLRAWRDERASDHPLCPCCERKANDRASKPKCHPLYRLFEQAIKAGEELHLTLKGDHVELSTVIIPHQIHNQAGFLIVTDEWSHSAIHIDMRHVHALAINNRVMDGQATAECDIYDSHGSLNFTIRSWERSRIRNWQRLCQSRR